MTSAADTGPHGAFPSTEPATVLYRERLWPALWLWLVVLGLGAGSTIALAPVSITAGFTAATVLLIALSAILIVTTPCILVTQRQLTVGRATIERRYLGGARAYEGEEASVQRGRELNATAYQCIRGWVPAVVRIEIVDPDDPTPYWLTSSRRPHQLVAALES